MAIHSKRLESVFGNAEIPGAFAIYSMSLSKRRRPTINCINSDCNLNNLLVCSQKD